MKATVLLVGLVMAAAGLGFAGSAEDPGPRTPCEGQAPVPAYPAVGQPPSVQTWTGVQWQAPPCLPWPHEQFRLIVALAGTFRYRGDSAGLLERFGAISRMRGLQYWSVSEQAWRVLITDAFASDGASPPRRRADFTAQEMKTGAELRFVEQDNRSGVVAYRMRVLEAGADRIVVATENVTPVRALAYTLFPPGTLRAAYFVQRQDAETWSFYGLSTTGKDASFLAGVSEASYVNRATALYRHFTKELWP